VFFDVHAPAPKLVIVGAVLYLASSLSSFNTGSVIVCDGGATT